jgi:hypothetical protein
MQSTPLSDAQLLERFQALDSFLLSYQHLWRPKPFTHLQLPWESQHPQLAKWLRCRTLAQAEAADNHPELLAAPAPFPEIAQRATALSAVGALPRHPRPPPNARLSSGVPGRKWQQISAFSDCLQFQQPPQHWLDWCSGKGHLGRLLAQDGSALSSLEYDPALVAAGQQLSQRAGLSAAHRLQDVFGPDTSEHLQRQHTPVALHACGDLHVRLLQLASSAGCQQLAVAPCCYNRIHGDCYQPLCSAAQASALQLSKDDLGLPLTETVTASACVRRQRNSSMARRLAFDQLQRELRDTDQYLPTPSLPSAWLDKSFANYCQDLAALKGLPEPASRDWAALEAQGWQRLAQVRNLELVRALFRRPLELWLLLDRALYLQAQGYQVRLGTFCAAQLSPRNLLLLAERK